MPLPSTNCLQGQNFPIIEFSEQRSFKVSRQLSALSIADCGQRRHDLKSGGIGMEAIVGEIFLQQTLSSTMALK